MINVDLNDIINGVTPPRLRSFENLAFLSALTEPLRDVLQSLYDLEAESKNDLAHNGQVIYLEHLLNNRYDNTLRRIWIGNNTLASNIFLFNEAEGNTPLYLFNNSESEPPVYLTNQSEISSTFVINVPTGIISNWLEFRAIVDRYKLKSKLYTINLF